MVTFKLVDDGTSDTVLQCNECGEQLRYNPDLVAGCSDDVRFNVALGMAEQDHEECAS